MVSILNDGHWMWVFRAERSIIGLHTPERANCKSQETESIRLLLPLSSSFPSWLSEGPSFSLDSDKEPERLDEKEVGVGRYPSDRVLGTHWSAPILAHSTEKAESLPLIKDRDWTEIGGLEGWPQHPDSGGRQVRSQPGLVSPDLVPSRIC